MAHRFKVQQSKTVNFFLKPLFSLNPRALFFLCLLFHLIALMTEFNSHNTQEVSFLQVITPNLTDASQVLYYTVMVHLRWPSRRGLSKPPMHLPLFVNVEIRLIYL